MRLRLGDALASIICQRLVKRSDQAGRRAACEILVASDAIKDCIRDPKKSGNITALQEQGDAYGMQTFDQHIIKMFQDQVLDLETARNASSSRSNFDRLVGIMKAERDLAQERAQKRADSSVGGEQASDDASGAIPGFERSAAFDMDD